MDCILHRSPLFLPSLLHLITLITTFVSLTSLILISLIDYLVSTVLSDNNKQLHSTDVSDPPKFVGHDSHWDDWYLQWRTYLEAKGWLVTITFEHPTNLAQVQVPSVSTTRSIRKPTTNYCLFPRKEIGVQYRCCRCRCCRSCSCCIVGVVVPHSLLHVLNVVINWIVRPEYNIATSLSSMMRRLQCFDSFHFHFTYKCSKCRFCRMQPRS